MTKFKRSKETIRKQILIDGIESEVIRDAKLQCHWDGHVYYERYIPERKNYTEYKVQFPRALRNPGFVYIADVYKRIAKSGTEFWSAYKGTIRNVGGDVIG